MTRALYAALLLAAPLPVAFAAPAAAQDARLVERFYEEAQVYRVDGRANVQTSIRFADDETIENVAVGDSQAWQVTPNKRANMLFVKPLADRATTNMTVVTSSRTYLFDLIASPAHKSPVYVLSFTYPEPEIDLADSDLPDAPTGVEIAAVSDPYAVVDPAQLNFAWTPRGEGNLLPSRIYDDGFATYLTWSAGTPLPAILVKDFEGTEGPVNFSVRGDVIVVDGVPREIVLRSGDDSATLRNNGPARPAPPPPALAQTANPANSAEVK